MIVRICSVVLRRTVVGVDLRFDSLSGSHHLMMITTNPDDHSNHNIDSPGFKPFTVIYCIVLYCVLYMYCIELFVMVIELSGVQFGVN